MRSGGPIKRKKWWNPERKPLKPEGHRAKRLKPGDKMVTASVKGKECICADPFYCRGEIQAAHIIGRDDEAIRHDLDNIVPLCEGHHDYYTNHPKAWRALIESLYPGRLQLLRDRSRGAA